MARFLSILLFVSVPLWAAPPFEVRFHQVTDYSIDSNISAPIEIETTLARYDEEVDTPILVQIQDAERPRMWWNGADWSGTPTRFNSSHANPHPFWRLLEIERTFDQSVPFEQYGFYRLVDDRIRIKLAQQDFTDAFWHGQQRKQVLLRIGHNMNGNDLYLETVTTLTRRTETRLDIDPTQTGFTVTLGGEADLRIQASLSHGAKLEPEKVSYRLHRRRITETSYWRQAGWANETEWLPLTDTGGSNGSIFQAIPNSSAEDLAHLATNQSSFIQEFWDEPDWRYYLTLRYEGGTVPFESKPVQLKFEVTPPDPIAVVNQGSNRGDSLTWQPVANYNPDKVKQAYAVAIQDLEDGSWLINEWRKPENWQTVDSFSLRPYNIRPENTYRAVVYSIFYTEVSEGQTIPEGSTGVFEPNIEQFVFANQGTALEFRFVKERFVPIELLSDLALSPINVYNLTNRLPNFEVSRTNSNSPLAGNWYVGLKDQYGEWLDPIWHQRPELKVYVPLRNGMVYDVYLQNEQESGRTNIRNMGQVRYVDSNLADPNRYQHDPDEIEYSNSVTFDLFNLSNPPNPEDIKVKIAYARNLYDTRLTPSLQEREVIFDGIKWLNLFDSSSFPGLTLSEAQRTDTLQASRIVKVSSNHYQIVIDFSSMAYPYHKILNITNTYPTEVEIEHNHVKHYKPIKINTKHFIATQDVFFNNNEPPIFHFSSSLYELTNQNTEWLWEDVHTGEFWNGITWLSYNDLPPWSSIPVTNQENHFWPPFSRSPNNGGFSITFDSIPFFHSFLSNRNSRRIKVHFRSTGQIQRTNYSTNTLSFLVTKSKTNFKTHISSQKWGTTPQNTEASIFFSPNSSAPSTENTIVNTEIPTDSPNSYFRHLVFSIYREISESSGSEPKIFEKWLQSDLIPISENQQSLTSIKAHNALTNLLHQDTKQTITETQTDTPYYLTASIITHTEITDQTVSEWNASISQLPVNWDVNISINGINLPLLTREQADNFDGSVGIPIHYRLYGELDIQSIDLAREENGPTIPFAFPENLDATAWVGKDDVLSARVHDIHGNENPELFEPTWELFRWNFDTQAWDFEERRVNQATFKFDQSYAAGVPYRIIYSVKDSFGFKETMVQDFGFVRDLSNVTATFRLSLGNVSGDDIQYQRLKLGNHAQLTTKLFGGENSDGFSIIVTDIEQDVYNASGIENTVPFPGLQLKFTSQNKNPNGSHAPIRTVTQRSTWKYIPEWLAECVWLNDGNPSRPYPDTAPFPVKLYNFEITDTWTGRSQSFSEAESSFEVSYNGNYECETNNPLPTSVMIPRRQEQPWYYQDDQVSNYAIETELTFDYTTYSVNPAVYNISIHIEPETGSEENPIAVNMPLNYYLAATGQSFDSFEINTVNVAQGRMRVVLGAFNPLPNNTTDAFEKTWRTALANANVLNPSANQTITRNFRINIFNRVTQSILTSTNQYRGDGFPITLQYGTPPQSRGITEMAYASVSKERVLFRDDLNGMATFIQELTANDDLNVDIVNWDNFYWKWQHNGEAWDGQNWVPAASGDGIQIGAAGAPLAESTATYDPVRKVIRLFGRIPVNTLPEAFWAKGNAIPLELAVSYRNTDGSFLAPNNPQNREGYRTQFTLFRTDNTLIQTPIQLSSGLGYSHAQALDVLKNVPTNSPLHEALSLAYAPEPFTLSSENVQDQADHTWVLAKQPLQIAQMEPPHDLIALESYAWLTLPFVPSQNQQEQHLVYLVPFPEVTSGSMPFNYANRQPVTLSNNQSTWQQNNHIFWRNAPGDNLNSAQFQIVVFVPETELVRSPLGQVERGFQQTNVNLQNFQSHALAFRDSYDHNRVATVEYPDPDDTQHKIITVLFADLTGRAQETRTMATKVSPEMLNKVIISGIKKFDSLGRQTKQGKSFLAAIGQYQDLGTSQTVNIFSSTPRELAAAGGRSDTFNAATRFWHTGNVRPGGLDTLPYIVEKDSAPIMETLYEQDPTRARVLGSIPMGEQARNPGDPLRYERYHFFTISARDGNGTLPEQLDLHLSVPTGNHLIPIETDDQSLEPGLNGTLAIDPNGLISMTLLGQNERKLFDIVNPDIDVLRDWGFEVRVGEQPAQLENHIIYLPADHASRMSQTANSSTASDRNLVTFHQYDDKGRLTATCPPRGMILHKPAGRPWTISTHGAGFSLATTFSYDNHDRMFSSHEADAGTSFYVYDRHGRVRLSQHGNTADGSIWRETIYDPEGRVVGTRSVDFRNFTGGFYFSNLQDFLDPQLTNIQPPADFGPLTGNIQVLPESFTETVYDRYDRFNERRPFVANDGATSAPTASAAFWPDFFELQAAYPWDDADFTFADPIGQSVESNSAHSAERVYYDFKGRVVCRVYLVRGVLEPQISWLQYDNRDLITAFYNQTHHQGLGFQYDAFGRLVHTLDLTPLADRMQIAVTHRQIGAEFTTPLATSVAALGPLIDETANINFDENQRSLTRWTYTPTGHIDQVTYGDAASIQVGNRYRYDVRDWLYQHRVEVGDVPTYSVDLDYFGLNDCFDGDCGQNGNALNDGVRRMFDGTIAILSETYHLTTELESTGSGSNTTVVPQVLRHEFGYDGIYQLTHAHHSWPQLYSQEYRYDRNGNRVNESQTNRPGVNGGPATTTNLSHGIYGNSNRLWDIAASDNSLGWDTMAFDYDGLGNVTQLQHYDTANGLSVGFRQELIYNDHRFPQLPTQINQNRLDNRSDDRLLTDRESAYRYDHNGARVYRQVGSGQTAETTYFVPSGNDNTVELDAWGRAKRYYLFNGEERFGYKSKRNTGLYVKDHLGSTKMVLAANRELPAADQSQVPTPTPAADLPSYQPLLAMPFEGDLTNDGLLAEGSATNQARYMSRNGRRALWLDRGDMITVPDDQRTDQLTEQFSLILWLYDEDEDDGDDDHGTLVCVGTQRSIRYNPIHWYIDGGKLPVLRVGGGAEGWQFLSQWSAVPRRTWVQLAVTFDGQVVRFYQDGEEVGEPQTVTLPALYPARQIALGDWPTYDGYRWNGGLDQVEIHTRVLQLEDIRAHYNQALTQPIPRAEADVAATQPTSYNQIRDLMIMRMGDTDPYGNSIREEYNSAEAGDEVEPHQFTGQEREHGTGLTYMGGRWYLPAAGRFIQTDPAKEFVNAYSYVGNNPVKYIDPTGKRLGFYKNVSPEYRQFFLYSLQQLTDHELALSTNEIVIKQLSSENNKPRGNLLVERIINTPHTNAVVFVEDPTTTTIVDVDAAVVPGRGSDTQMNWNPHFTPRVFTQASDGTSEKAGPIPMFLAIAHELIHADRANRGVYSKAEKGPHIFQEKGKNKPTTQQARPEELIAIGVKPTPDKNTVTENQIRAEQKKPIRTAH